MLPQCQLVTERCPDPGCKDLFLGLEPLLYDDAFDVGEMLLTEVSSKPVCAEDCEAELTILAADIAAATQSCGYPADELARTEGRVLETSDMPTALVLGR